MEAAGSGPSLKYLGVDYVAGQFGTWTPIGAEQTASGYEVAWKVTGSDQYRVWNTDSNGNQISQTAILSGTSVALELLETSFHQDLNHDGVIGVPVSGTVIIGVPASGTVIEAYGSTGLVEAGTHYYLDNSNWSGPSLKYLGVDYVAGHLVRGRRLARNRRPAGMRWPGRSRAPISIECGTPTATVTKSHKLTFCRELALRWNRLRPVSTRT